MQEAALAGAIAKHLGKRRALIAEALDAVYRGHPAPVTLESLEVTAAGSLKILAPDVAKALIADKLHEQFVAVLRTKGLRLVRADKPEAAAEAIRADWEGLPQVDETFDNKVERKFLDLAPNVRCMIRVDGEVKGSGVLVGRRLVLTAAHVVDEVPTLTDGRRPGIKVEAAGETEEARVVFRLPCHESDSLGEFPPAGCPECRDQADVALLRTEKPLGQIYGRISLPENPIPGRGIHQMALLHYPDGRPNSYTSRGRVRRGPTDLLRQPHDIRTSPGSSGGPAFNNNYEFLGLHQGRFVAGDRGRIVPFDCYFDNRGFQSAIGNDRAVDYLWSLDGTPEGEFVIGRRDFIEAVDAIVAGTYPALRGIWVRRRDPSDETGVGFTYKLLQALVEPYRTEHRVVSVSASLAMEDIIEATGQLALGSGPVPGSRAGVRANETTVPAHDQDRANALAEALQATAANHRQTLWIVFENPPAGLQLRTQIQLGQLISAMLTRQALRVVVAGYETYHLVERLMEKPAEGESGPRGLVAEYVGGFTREDIAFTLQMMAASLGFDWPQPVRDHIVRRALLGQMADGGRYPSSALGNVALELRQNASASMRNG